MLTISKELLAQIHAHGEEAYPEEGAGFLVGADGHVEKILPLSNAREESARRNRYLITAEEYAKAEEAADSLTLSLIGVFHSHPDHPNRPSEFDREHALPYFSYIITSVQSGKAVESRSWKLSEDRLQFVEEKIQTI
ncbi:MAG: M67 family metallopeptidase [Anaerolineales bacterium]|nr:MAG: M67 family metallopeptidase [Anaerolineales bacterium]